MDPTEFLQRLVEKCPGYAKPVPDCPLAAVRAAPNPQQKVSSLPNEEVDNLIRAHFLCVCRREGCGS